MSWWSENGLEGTIEGFDPTWQGYAGGGQVEGFDPTWRPYADPNGDPGGAPPVPTNAPPEGFVAPQNQGNLPSWANTPRGQQIIAQLKATLGFSDAEAWAHVDRYKEAPDDTFLSQIIANIRAQRQTPPAGATGNTAATTTTPTNGPRWDEGWFTANIGRPTTVKELEALESKITAAGGKLLRNAAGVAGKIQTPDGRIVDVMYAAGLGGQGFQWLEGDGGSGGSGGTALDPWTQQFTPPPDFVAPTGAEVFDDPGVQFRLKQANEGFERSKSAQGTLRTGGTLQELAALNQDLASQEYGKLYNRRFGEYENRYGNARSEYDLSRNIFEANQDRPFSKLFSLAGLGNLSVPQYGTAYANLVNQGVANSNDYLTQGANANAAGQAAGANIWGQTLSSFGQDGLDFAAWYAQKQKGSKAAGPWSTGYAY